ncbi:hypothetical protein C922_05140 [Plasmodium inui San Antonio 1]|uniref:Uncharacterized protein n=1 Tax=Plasmodium inui San Antonio 1 TaxID=1237626 RepID=W6ZU76_9APIC|nr:hypothetical protein C922_05140 [Plasmodium inui San Antonio 1]EUD64477.1 hypothetical protein C922_05140 [Plasmodium inui San Antonio 1]
MTSDSKISKEVTTMSEQEGTGLRRRKVRSKSRTGLSDTRSREGRNRTNSRRSSPRNSSSKQDQG